MKESEASETKFDRIMRLTAEMAEMKAELKRQCMVYQREAKIAAAKKRGLPFDAYFDTPYDEWSRIRD